MKYIDFSLCLDYFICNGNNLHLQSQFLFYHETKCFFKMRKYSANLLKFK